MLTQLTFVYDNFGDISAWVDSNGFTKYATIYDLNNGLRNELYNPPPGINVPLGWNGRNGDITIQVGTDRDLIVNNEGSDFSITNPWGATDTMGWARPPKTTKGGLCGNENGGSKPCCIGTDACCKHPANSIWRYTCFCAGEWAEKSGDQNKKNWADCMQKNLANKTKGEKEGGVTQNLFKLLLHAIDVLNAVTKDCVGYSNGILNGLGWTIDMYNYCYSLLDNTGVGFFFPDKGNRTYSYYDSCCE